jgi:DNA-directed RNA polymerase specialized sigma24 family protein
VRARRRVAVPVGDVPEAVAPAVTPEPVADEDLWGRVRELPPKQRTALALRYVTDAGYDEISSVMGTSEDAARRNVHEALKRLRTEYRP